MDLLCETLLLALMRGLLGVQILPTRRYLRFIALKLGKVNDLRRIGIRPALFLPVATP